MVTELRTLMDSWELAMRAERKAPRTIETYLLAAGQFTDWLQEQGPVPPVANIDRNLVRAWLAHLDAAGRSPNTVKQRYSSLSQFFRWLVEEEEIPASPMAGIKPPAVPDNPPPVIPQEQLRALLGTCTGRDFVSRRDRALILVLADTGVRRSEVVGMKVEDVNLKNQTATVLGKGDRRRVVPLGLKTTQALDRYLRERSRHKWSDSAKLWLGEKGKPPITKEGVKFVLRRRAQTAGIEKLHPHLFRHTMAHEWLDSGGNEGDLMEIMGWKSPQMLRRYGRSAAAARARRAHARHSLGDRL